MKMNREASIQFLEQENFIWDIVVIGGGATGLGVALDSAIRGYKTLLLEQSDFTKGTSSRSTKLVHGGVRYLAQGNIKLVLEALHERGLLLKNAPHITYNQSFVIPSYNWFDGLFYTIGLKLYDLLAGVLSLGKSEMISSKRVIEFLSTINTSSLKNGILYHDGQFDDARLGINLAQSCVDQGAHLLNYAKVTSLSKNKEGNINELLFINVESQKEFSIKTKAVVNATGVFVDKVLAMDDPSQKPIVRASQGTHIVLDSSFLPSQHALMIPKTDDGRVLFAVPWHDKIVVGTTDTIVDQEVLEPRALVEEVEFILSTFGRYITKKPTKKDVLSVFSGLRPLARPSKEGKKTKEISRNHKLIVSDSGLVTITGGKWTTYRKMAEDTVNKVIEVAGLKNVKCTTHEFKIHGYETNSDKRIWLHTYGSDSEKIQELMSSSPFLAEKIHPDYPYVKAEIVWAVKNEMARKVEDFLARRIRILFMDAKAAIEMAPIVANLMAKELAKNEDWELNQVAEFQNLAKGYLL